MNSRVLWNFVGFQIGWFACVLGGAHHLPWLGTSLGLVLLWVHLRSLSPPWSELGLVLTVGFMGAVWDSLLVALGLLSYPSGTLIAGTAPHWIVMMWMLFATTLNLGLRWLRKRRLLTAIMGGVFGPLAFYAGHRLGGVEFSDPWVSLTILALGWAILLPLSMALAKGFDGAGTFRLYPMSNSQSDTLKGRPLS